MKTDNRNLSAKVALRRHVLDANGITSCRVLDLFAGEGHIWKAMAKHITLETYMPVDRKPRMAGTVKATITPRFLSALDLTRFNVIDVDTYGEPWEFYLQLLGQITTPSAVFLTCGTLRQGGFGSGGFSTVARKAIGIPDDWETPYSYELKRWAGEYILRSAMLRFQAKTPVRYSLANVLYFGIYLQNRLGTVGLKGDI